LTLSGRGRTRFHEDTPDAVHPRARARSAIGVEESVMKLVGRLLLLVWNAFILALIASALMARALKRRLIPVDGPEIDDVRLGAVFAPISFVSKAASFRGGELDCWFGGGVIDLRSATLDPAGATFHVNAVFGGAQFVVPETWHVTSRVVGIGGLADARPAAERPEDAPQLVIEGRVLFGGFSVVSDLPEAQAKALAEAVETFGHKPQVAAA
jgi:hypothetical protein